MRATRTIKASLVWLLLAVFLVVHLRAAVGFKDPWKQSGIAPAAMSFEIRGTKGRNNPIRRQLQQPFHGEELFVRFSLRYGAEGVDRPGEGDGEFFVLWFDEEEGHDGSTHSGSVPNLGIHVRGDENHFMVRYAARREKYTEAKLEGDRKYRIVGRLWKTRPGAKEPFDALDIWVDPETSAEMKPDASTRSSVSVSEVNWIGFSTGGKTEMDDRINVSGITVAETWAGILGLPPKVDLAEIYRPKPPPVVKKTVTFKDHVYPLLKRRCFECHQGAKAKGGVRLDVWDEVMNQTSPRNADASRLLALVLSDDPDERMPPKGDRLSEEEIKVLKAWINEGMEWDEGLLPTPRPQSDHWAFQPIQRPAVPKIGSAWGRNPIDKFIGKKHAELGLKPAREAEIATLRRRASLDLIGLPPDDGDEGFDSFVETLLKSKHHGERWGRHWLDLARWAESNGHQHNRDRPHAWRYRDYVIRAMNADRPFDQFVREQLAGDELPFAKDHLIATGFLSGARYSGNELDKELQRNDILVDIVNTTASTFLGLTVECAQCHTHKFDPISIRDYYRLQAFFVKGQPGNVVLKNTDDRVRDLLAQRWQIFDGVRARRVNAMRKQGYPEPVLVQPTSVVKSMRVDERKAFDSLEREIAKLPQVWGFYSPITAAQELGVAPHVMRWPLPRYREALQYASAHLLVRGDVGSKGPVIEPGLPAVFGALPEAGKHPRLALANWLGSSENPLTARVWVNRIWQWHFGQGLVETSNDFGTRGAKPSHPDLLDWLASELVDSGWSTRHIHRLILDSSTYRQSSIWSAANAEIDPNNLRLWRWQPRRLEAESLRDSMLRVAGVLDLKMSGPSVPRRENDTSNRRSIYLQQKRDNLPHQQMLFDGSPAVTSCSRRAVSTVASQPLYLLNSSFSQRISEAFAKRVWRKDSRVPQQAKLAIEMALNREATAEEITKSAELISSDGLAKFCQALLNLNEFVYIP